MRRSLSAILLMTVFISLQFGKVTSYLYCKFQAEIVQNKADCGCDDHLVSIFDHKDDNSKNEKSKITLNEKLNEFPPGPSISVPYLFASTEKNFAEYVSSLSESFPEAPFHPPV